MSQRDSGRAPEHRACRTPDGAVVVELLGEPDLGIQKKTGALLTKLIDGHDLVVVDVSETSFIDSSILESLVQAHRHAQAHGSKLRIQLGSVAIVQRMFEISGLANYFDVVADREEALRR